MPRTAPAVVLVSLALLLAGAGCRRHAASAPAAASRTQVLPPEHRFAIGVGGEVVQMRLAVYDNERSRGLMGVTSMPEDEGMLFVWARPQRMNFYMRNTRIPLDIGYFDGGGVLREIYPMYPGVEDGVTSLSSGLRYALEMNQGWYVRHGVKPGAELDRNALRAALQARGFEAERFVDAP